MKAISFLITFLVCSNCIACNLKKDFDYISLSGPITFLLQQLDLLNDKKLKGISLFAPVDTISFKNKVYGGGLFLSDKEKSDFDNKVIFYDNGLELKKYLESSNASEKIVIDTRTKGCIEATNIVINQLKPYLNKCEEKLKKIQSDILKIKNELQSYEVKNKEKTYLFYLGKINKNKLPNLIISNDGPIKSLKDFKILKSYPSDFAYVSWSQKTIKSLKDITHIGVGEGEQFEVIKIDQDKLNILSPGALTPGLSQLYFLEKLLGLRLF